MIHLLTPPILYLKALKKPEDLVFEPNCDEKALKTGYFQHIYLPLLFNSLNFIYRSKASIYKGYISFL